MKYIEIYDQISSIKRLSRCTLKFNLQRNRGGGGGGGGGEVDWDLKLPIYETGRKGQYTKKPTRSSSESMNMIAPVAFVPFKVISLVSSCGPTENRPRFV